jgi:hypothetical protein
MRGVALSVLVVAAFAGSALAGAASTIAQPTPTGTLRAEIVTFNAHNWRAAYSAFTPEYKARCPYATFARVSAAVLAQLSGPLAVRNISSRIRGSKAFLAYQVVSGGRVLGAFTNTRPDVFVRIGRLWYDEYEGGSTACN